MYKTHKIVLIPTDNNTNIHLKDGTLSTGILYLENFIGNKHNSFHLYILSDEEITKGDWCICYESIGLHSEIKEYKILKCSKSNHYRKGDQKHLHLFDNNNYEYSPDKCKKIIATTDRSLVVNVSKPLGVTRELPNIPLEFVEKYIEEYNKGNVITEVMVEHKFDYAEEDTECWGDEIEKLKIDKNNQIIITTRTKDNWNRKEVIELMKKFKEETELFSTSSIVKENKSFMTIEQIENKWIEENL